MKKRRIIKIVLLVLCVVIGIMISPFAVFAIDSTSVGGMPEEYYGMIEELPEDVADRLPDGFYSDNTDEIGVAVEELISFEYIFSFIEELLGTGLRDAFKLVARLCGILVISAVFSSFKSSLRSEALSKTIGFCSSCAVFAAVIDMQYENIEMVSAFFERLNALFLGMIPITGTLYAMGGNIKTAVAGNGAMYVFLAVSERICAQTVIPVSCICIGFALCRGVAPEINIQGISSGIKKCYVFILGMIMTILVSLLATQTTLTAAADSTVARGAKMVTSSMIPHVGGAVGDTLRTVASSVQYMKGIVGVSGIIFILILLLPTLLSLVLTRFAFLVSGCIADILGCDSESKLIGELGNVYACMIAAVSMSSVMFIFAMNIFIKTTVAVM